MRVVLSVSICMYVVMAYIVMAYIVMAHIVVAYLVMAYIVMAYLVMAYIVTAGAWLQVEEIIECYRDIEPLTIVGGVVRHAWPM